MAAFIKSGINYFAALYPQPGGGARINIYCDEGYRLYVIFKPSPADATNSYDAGTKTGVGYADIALYPFYLDLLRNEKPVNVTFNPEAKTFVVHANEPVGEGEI